MKLLDALQEYGVDIERTLARFLGNEALYLRFLQKFLQDENSHDTLSALEEENYEEALRKAHTLKGVAANLGMDSLSVICAEIVDRIRSGEQREYTDLQQRLQTEYKNYVTLIEETDEKE